MEGGRAEDTTVSPLEKGGLVPKRHYGRPSELTRADSPLGPRNCPAVKRRPDLSNSLKNLKETHWHRTEVTGGKPQSEEKSRPRGTNGRSHAAIIKKQRHYGTRHKKKGGSNKTTTGVDAKRLSTLGAAYPTPSSRPSSRRKPHRGAKGPRPGV